MTHETERRVLKPEPDEDVVFSSKETVVVLSPLEYRVFRLLQDGGQLRTSQLTTSTRTDFPTVSDGTIRYAVTQLNRKLPVMGASQKVRNVNLATKKEAHYELVDQDEDDLPKPTLEIVINNLSPRRRALLSSIRSSEEGIDIDEVVTVLQPFTEKKVSQQHAYKEIHKLNGNLKRVAYEVYNHHAGSVYTAPSYSFRKIPDTVKDPSVPTLDDIELSPRRQALLDAARADGSSQARMKEVLEVVLGTEIPIAKLTDEIHKLNRQIRPAGYEVRNIHEKDRKTPIQYKLMPIVEKPSETKEDEIVIVDFKDTAVKDSPKNVDSLAGALKTFRKKKAAEKERLKIEYSRLRFDAKPIDPTALDTYLLPGVTFVHTSLDIAGVFIGATVHEGMMYVVLQVSGENNMTTQIPIDLFSKRYKVIEPDTSID